MKGMKNAADEISSLKLRSICLESIGIDAVVEGFLWKLVHFHNKTPSVDKDMLK